MPLLFRGSGKERTVDTETTSRGAGGEVASGGMPHYAAINSISARPLHWTAVADSHFVDFVDPVP